MIDFRTYVYWIKKHVLELWTPCCVCAFRPCGVHVTNTQIQVCLQFPVRRDLLGPGAEFPPPPILAGVNITIMFLETTRKSVRVATGRQCLQSIGKKIKLSLYLIKHDAMKTYGGVEV